MVFFKFLGQLIHAVAGGHRKRAQIIRQAGGFRRDEVRERVIELPCRFFHLLPQRVKRRQHLLARFIGVKFDVVTDAVGREKAIDARGR